jgi:hypothetical protein
VGGGAAAATVIGVMRLSLAVPLQVASDKAKSVVGDSGTLEASPSTLNEPKTKKKRSLRRDPVAAGPVGPGDGTVPIGSTDSPPNTWWISSAHPVTSLRVVTPEAVPHETPSEKSFVFFSHFWFVRFPHNSTMALPS